MNTTRTIEDMKAELYAISSRIDYATGLELARLRRKYWKLSDEIDAAEKEVAA